MKGVEASSYSINVCTIKIQITHILIFFLFVKVGTNKEGGYVRSVSCLLLPEGRKCPLVLVDVVVETLLFNTLNLSSCR